MADGFIGVREPTAIDKRVDNEQLTVGGQTVQRQRVNINVEEFTGRMMAKIPAPGYALWVDLADALHLYVLEAETAKTATDTGFRGVRVPKTAGKVQVNTGATLTFANRTTDGGWA